MNYSIIGAGPAGIEAAHTLALANHKVTIFEQENAPLTHIADKAFLFPNFSEAKALEETLKKKLEHPNITLLTSTPIVSITHPESHDSAHLKAIEKDSLANPSYPIQWQLTDDKGNNYQADKLLITTGYTPFDAHRKEELGYGIYKGVHTSLELEAMLREQKVVNTIGDTPKRITLLQCVGSRDEKMGNHYCSKVCCVTAVKQAIELRKLLPETEVYIFYMDLRMWGQGFEEMYRQAQETYNVHFVRGRISEAAGTFDGKVQIKAEDTLMGVPMKMTTDLLVLMVGMEASKGTKSIGNQCGICGNYGFLQSRDPHLGDNLTTLPNLYLAGTCKRPMSINDVLNDARSAAIAMSIE